MSNYELEQALACKQMEVEDLRRQIAEQAEAIDLQLHTNKRIAELEEKVAKWVEKAKNWSASPEAGKQLEGYRTMGAKCAELEAERDQLRQQVTLLRDVMYRIAFSRTGQCVDLAQELFAHEECAAEALAATEQKP